MAPNQNLIINSNPMEPVSRTYQYRKVMKPLLERKRRARINRSLDELKEMMTTTCHNEGENVAKLEKADILELTVRHLRSLRETNALYIRHQDQTSINVDRFWDGFRQCAGEVSHFLSKFDNTIGTELLRHINGYTKNLENVSPSRRVTTPLQSAPGLRKHMSIQQSHSEIHSGLYNKFQRSHPIIQRPYSTERKLEIESKFHDKPGDQVWRPW